MRHIVARAPDAPQEIDPSVTGSQEVTRPAGLAVEAMRRAHAAYVRGDRDPETVVGERAYNSWRRTVIRHAEYARRDGYRGCGCKRCEVAA